MIFVTSLYEVTDDCSANTTMVSILWTVQTFTVSVQTFTVSDIFSADIYCFCYFLCRHLLFLIFLILTFTVFWYFHFRHLLFLIFSLPTFTFLIFSVLTFTVFETCTADIYFSNIFSTDIYSDTDSTDFKLLNSSWKVIGRQLLLIFPISKLVYELQVAEKMQNVSCCWENEVGEEVFKVILVDLGLLIAVGILFHLHRALWAKCTCKMVGISCF